jgi:hypothetical protein
MIVEVWLEAQGKGAISERAARKDCGRKNASRIFATNLSPATATARRGYNAHRDWKRWDRLGMLRVLGVLGATRMHSQHSQYSQRSQPLLCAFCG